MKVLLALSGGIDSMVMADMYVSHNLSCGEAAGVAHCNFHLRGEESDGDAALVREWAESHSIPFHQADFDTVGYAAERGISVEMAARELRYSWFAGLCGAEGYDAVAVAHHADDNAETLILNLLRGSGGRGLCGMKKEGTVPVEGSSVTLLRPLLGMTRTEIASYASLHGIRYREDSTNADTSIRRNLIRHEIFPLFSKINPSFRETLSRSMGYYAEEWDIAGEWLEEWLPVIIKESVSGASAPGKKWTVLSKEGLAACGHPSFALFRILGPLGFGAPVLEDILRDLEDCPSSSGKRFYSCEDENGLRSIAVTAGRFILVGPADEDTCGCSLEIASPGIYQAGGSTVKVEIFERPGHLELKQPEGILIFDADKLRFPFLIRRWKDGDWLRPLGMGGRKKISDLFVDLKIPLPLKGDALVVEPSPCAGSAEPAGQQRVLSLLGYRIDESVKVDANTDKILRIWLEANHSSHSSEG